MSTMIEKFESSCVCNLVLKFVCNKV